MSDRLLTREHMEANRKATSMNVQEGLLFVEYAVAITYPAIVAVLGA